jgi:hypothetical protein
MGYDFPSTGLAGSRARAPAYGGKSDSAYMAIFGTRCKGVLAVNGLLPGALAAGWRGKDGAATHCQKKN